MAESDTPDVDVRERLRTLNIYDPRDADDVLDLMRAARKVCPVAHSEQHGGYWVVSRYEDVKAVLHDDATFSSSQGKSIPRQRPMPLPPLDADPPLHADFRSLLNPHFSKPAVERHEAAVRDVCRTTISRWIDRGRFDAMRDFASPFMANILARVILDLDNPEEVEAVQSWVEDIHEVGPRTEDGWTNLRAYVEKLLDERRDTSRSQGDIVAAISQGTVDHRPLTGDEKTGVVMLLFLASLDSSRSTVVALLDHIARTPGLEDRVRNTRWMRSDFDELLRFISPVTGTARYVMRDCELAGQKMSQGDWVMAHLGSANHDEGRFADPDDLDFERPSNQHIAFGLGIHRCLGSNLAQLQIRVGMEELLAQVRNLRNEGEPSRRSPGVVWHPVDLVLHYDRV